MNKGKKLVNCLFIVDKTIVTFRRQKLEHKTNIRFSYLKNSLLVVVFCCAISAFGQEGFNANKKHREQLVQDIGDYAQHAPTLASLVVIIIKKDKKGLWQFSKSFGTNIVMTHLLKIAIDKPRPDGRTDGHAFPSGHTSVAFQSAAFLQKRYGWSYGIPAYVVASFVAYSRLEGIHHRHDGWDILAGALLGIGSTYLFTTPYEKQHFELSYSGGNGNHSVGLKYKF